MAILAHHVLEILLEALFEFREERALGVDERVHMQGGLLAWELSVRKDFEPAPQQIE